jgi:hypothetical protein
VGGEVTLLGHTFELQEFRPRGFASFCCVGFPAQHFAMERLAQQVLDAFPESHLKIKAASDNNMGTYPGYKARCNGRLLVCFERATDIEKFGLYILSDDRTRLRHFLFTPIQGATFCRGCRDGRHIPKFCPAMKDVEMRGSHDRLVPST